MSALATRRIFRSTFCLGMFFALGAFLGTDDAIAQFPIAERLQSVRPNLLLAESINQRGMIATEEACIRPEDEVWLVSSRDVDGFTLNSCRLNTLQLIDGHWCDSSVDTLQERHGANQSASTFVYVHGNMTDLNWSIVRALEVYKNLIAKQADSPPVRFVIWSWPSERQTVPIRDALVKSRRAVCEGYTLRAFLDFLGSDRPMLLGYSFGAQVVLSSLQSPTSLSSGQPFQVALIAPAFDRDFIHCELKSCSIASDTEELQAFVNENDRVIRANNYLCRRKYRHSSICDYRVSSKLNGCESYLTEVDISHKCQNKHSIILYSQMDVIAACVNEQLARMTGSSVLGVSSVEIQHPAEMEPEPDSTVESGQ